MSTRLSQLSRLVVRYSSRLIAEVSRHSTAFAFYISQLSVSLADPIAKPEPAPDPEKRMTSRLAAGIAIAILTAAVVALASQDESELVQSPEVLSQSVSAEPTTSVEPGDIVVGDRDGVIVVPPAERPGASVPPVGLVRSPL